MSITMNSRRRYEDGRRSTQDGQERVLQRHPMKRRGAEGKPFKTRLAHAGKGTGAERRETQEGQTMKLKDKKITIYEQATQKDSQGFSRTSLENITDGTLWAYFRHLSGKEVFAAATTNYKEEVLFQVNHRDDITTSCVVEYGGILYDITRIDTFEGYNTDLTLYCKRRSRQ